MITLCFHVWTNKLTLKENLKHSLRCSALFVSGGPCHLSSWDVIFLWEQLVSPRQEEMEWDYIITSSIFWGWVSADRLFKDLIVAVKWVEFSLIWYFKGEETKSFKHLSVSFTVGGSEPGWTKVSSVCRTSARRTSSPKQKVTTDGEEQCDGLSLDTNDITDPNQQVRTLHPNNIIISCEFCRDERSVRSRLRHVSHHQNHHNTILLLLPYREDQRVEVRRENVICQILKDKPWREKVEKSRYQQRYLKTSMLDHVFDVQGEKK